MTLSRRSFTFASLVAALTPSAARASAPAVAEGAPSVIPEIEEAGTAAGLKVKAELSLDRRTVTMHLQVTNEGEDVEVLVAQGARAAGELKMFARVDGARLELEPVVGPVDRREMMSRMGPIARYQSLKRHESITLGPYRFQLSDPAIRPPVEVEGPLWTAAEPAPVKLAGLTWGPPRAGA